MKKSVVRALLKYVSRGMDDLVIGKYRNDFMRDRDRIVYSRPFRRLSRKTQIFLPASDDHVRTRLTHSLEVAQISITSSQALGLDLDLTEAIALGHDLGHTPFGHTGERILNLIATNCDLLGNLAPTLNIEETGFKHNLQGLRVACDLSSLYEGLPGLNLSNYTLWGIQNHTNRNWKKCGYLKVGGSNKCNYPQNIQSNQCRHEDNRHIFENKFYDKYDNLLKLKTNNKGNGVAWSFEGLLVKMGDEIAQRHHDIEDGLIANVIQIYDVLDLIKQLIAPYFTKYEKIIFEDLGKKELNYVIPKISKLVVGCLNRSLIENSIHNLKSFCDHFSIRNRNDFENIYPTLSVETKFNSAYGMIRIDKIISYPPDMEKDDDILKDNLSNVILNSYQVQRMDGKARFIIRQLAKAYLSNPQQLPNNMINQLFDQCYPDKSAINELHTGEKRAWLNEMYYSKMDKTIRNNLLRVICDWISGMTDDFALIEHAKLYSTSENLDLRQY